MSLESSISLKDLQKKPFSLVLSGGSAFGLAHIGILDFLDQLSLKPTEIIGTSMGAIVASFYAMGKSAQEIYEIMNSLNFLKLIKLNIGGSSFLSHDSVRKHLRKFYGDITIAMLPTDLKIASTDAATGDPIIFSKNSPERLIDILCTTFSIPVIFSPFSLNDKIYYDGFLSSNLPIHTASEKLILAIDVINKSQLKTFTSNSVQSILKRSFIISILNQSRLMHQICEKKKIITVEPDVSGFDFTDFLKVTELRARGKEAMKHRFT